MITERTLKKWRREALQEKDDIMTSENVKTWSNSVPGAIATQERILRMTQELLDQHLLRKEYW